MTAPRRPPIDPAIASAIEQTRRRLAHATDPDERRLLRESLARWLDMAKAARQP